MEFSKEHWNTFTLAQQLGNVGSDFDRAVKWREKDKPALFMNAASRALEQLDMTLTSPRLHGARRREIARVREVVCEELFGETGKMGLEKQLSKYFFSMASLAQAKK